MSAEKKPDELGEPLEPLNVMGCLDQLTEYLLAWLAQRRAQAEQDRIVRKWIGAVRRAGVCYRKRTPVDDWRYC